jgi:hypothetical protein
MEVARTHSIHIMTKDKKNLYRYFFSIFDKSRILSCAFAVVFRRFWTGLGVDESEVRQYNVTYLTNIELFCDYSVKMFIHGACVFFQ